MKKKILVVAAHPDDEVLGCGATVARLTEENNEVFVLLLGEGLTSRDIKRERTRKENELKKQARKANEFLGIKKIFIYDFPDNKFDTVPLLDIIKTIEKIKVKIKPDVIYTHHRRDLNIDHRITYNAVLTACRPIKGETVKEIYSFEIPSSTEWNYPYIFNPNLFIDISKTIDKKIEALQCYKDEIRDFPHPRSEKSVKIIAERWGSIIGVNYAEAFEVIRIVKKQSE